jgi:hypothetical protein
VRSAFCEDLFRAAFGQNFRPFVAKLVGIKLPELLAAPVPVHISERANIHHKIEHVWRAAKVSRQFITPRARTPSYSQQLRYAVGVGCGQSGWWPRTRFVSLRHTAGDGFACSPPAVTTYINYAYMVVGRLPTDPTS